MFDSENTRCMLRHARVTFETAAQPSTVGSVMEAANAHWDALPDPKPSLHYELNPKHALSPLGADGARYSGPMDALVRDVLRIDSGMYDVEVFPLWG